jgi:hypothetical protein
MQHPVAPCFRIEVDVDFDLTENRLDCTCASLQSADLSQLPQTGVTWSRA